MKISFFVVLRNKTERRSYNKANGVKLHSQYVFYNNGKGVTLLIQYVKFQLLRSNSLYALLLSPRGYLQQFNPFSKCLSVEEGNNASLLEQREPKRNQKKQKKYSIFLVLKFPSRLDSLRSRSSKYTLLPPRFKTILFFRYFYNPDNWEMSKLTKTALALVMK